MCECVCVAGLELRFRGFPLVNFLSGLRIIIGTKHNRLEIRHRIVCTRPNAEVTELLAQVYSNLLRFSYMMLYEINSTTTGVIRNPVSLQFAMVCDL